jgi:hypothetical protein
VNTRRQEEELIPEPTPARGSTPFLRLRLTDDGKLVFTNALTSIRFREDADGKLIPSDDTAKAAATSALVGDGRILTYLPS